MMGNGKWGGKPPSYTIHLIKHFSNFEKRRRGSCFFFFSLATFFFKYNGSASVEGEKTQKEVFE